MQGNFVRAVSRLALFAGVPLIAALATPEGALAACGTGQSAGVHTGTASTGVHAATSAVKTGSAGGGSGTLGCANGSSASTSTLHRLTTAASGKVVEGGIHPAAHARTAARKTANASAHLRSGKSLRHP